MKRIFVLLLLLLSPAVIANWYPVPVIADGKKQQYSPLPKAQRQWRLCALLPHGKDHYWWGVAWGLSEEAARQGVMLGIYEAGGYENATKQAEQLALCAQKQADAYIIAAISANGLDAQIRELSAKGIPVIDLINGIDSAGVSSHSSLSFAGMSAAAARYILKQQGNKPLKLAWFPGPEGAAWVRDAEAGLTKTLRGSQTQVLHAGYGPTDAFSQAGLARDFFAKNPDIDVVLANAVAAKVVSQLLQKQILQNEQAGKSPDDAKPSPKIIAYYANPAVIELLQQGQIAAAVTDSPVLQARIAVDLAVRLLQKERVPAYVAPQIEVLQADNLASYPINRLLPPDEQWIIRRELLDLPEKPR
ncbi:TMAO reductase system periplasmic protein TorT [Rheinheimera sp.]|uniref:TMAO reductase system periplasmic protein TorT n=1 Tax=Rheinheimera sp. TaxID=1869214 RepID=UPI002FDD35A0